MSDTENQEPEGQQTDEEYDTESSRYWNEAVNAREGGTQEPEPVEKEPAPDKEESEDTDETTDSAETEAGVEETPEEDIETEDDPWADIPDERRKEFEEYKAKAEKYEHETRSNRGRLAALQRKYDELSRKLEEATTKKEDIEPPVDPGDSIFDFPEWKAFEDDFGDVAKPQKAAMRRLYEVMHSRLSDTDKVSKDLQKQQQEEQYAREAQALDEMKPGWLNYVQENFEDLQAFANSDPALKTMWEANFEEITNAKQAKRLFDLYELEKGATNGKAKEKSATEKESKPNSEPRPLSTKRQQQLKSAATIAPRSHPAPGRRSDDLPDPDDESAAWHYFAEKVTR